MGGGRGRVRLNVNGHAYLIRGFTGVVEMVGVGGGAGLAEVEMDIFCLLNWPPARPVVVSKA